MLTERGRIVAVEGETVWVETLRNSACGSCAARSGCGHDLMNRVTPGASRGIVRARRAPDLDAELAVHDSVTLALPESSFLKAASLLYLLPLVAAVGAAGLTDFALAAGGTARAWADLAVAGATLAGLALGLAGVRFLGAPAGAEARFEPRVTAKL